MRNLRSNTFKALTAQYHQDVLYVLYVIFQKKALSNALYAMLKHMDLVKDQKSYKKILKELEDVDLIKRKKIEVFDKYSKHEEVVLKQFSIDYIADLLEESPVAVAQSRTSTATMNRTAKALYLLEWRGDLIAKHGINYWNKLIQSTTFFISPNKSIEWINWFKQYIEHFKEVPQISENLANLSAIYTKESQKFTQNLRLGSKSSHNKGKKSAASPMLEESVPLKSMVVEENVHERTKENILDDVTLHKIMNNNIYLSAKKAVDVSSTGKIPSIICFNVAILDIRNEASFRSYLLKLAYAYQFITQDLLLDAYDVPFEVDFVTMEAQQAENLKEALNALKTEDLERYGLALPFENGNLKVSIRSINLRESLQKK